MKKVLILMLSVLLVILCACNAQKPEEIGSTTIYFANDGSITATYVEDFSQPQYDMEELRTMTEEGIAAYNTTAGADKIAMTYFEVEGNIAKMQLTFTDAAAYSDYIGEDVFVGTIAEALEADYDLDVSLVNVTNSEDVIGEHELLTMQESKIVIVEDQVHVRTESKIVYMSSDAKYIDEYEVDGFENPDATVIIY